MTLDSRPDPEEPDAQGPILDKLGGLFSFIAAVPGFIPLIRKAFELRNFTLEKEGFFLWLGSLSDLFTEGAALTETDVDDDIAAVFALIVENRAVYDMVYDLVTMFTEQDEPALCEAALDGVAVRISDEPAVGVSPTIIVLALQLLLIIVKYLRGE